MGAKDEDDKHRLWPSADWLAAARAAYRRLGRGEKGLVMEQAGISKQQVNRMFPVEDPDETVDPAPPIGPVHVSFNAWESMRVALNEHAYRDGAPPPTLPVPFIAVEDEDEALWIRSGRTIREADKEFWAVTLDILADTAAHLETRMTVDELLRDKLEEIRIRAEERRSSPPSTKVSGRPDKPRG